MERRRVLQDAALVRLAPVHDEHGRPGRPDPARRRDVPAGDGDAVGRDHLGAGGGSLRAALQHVRVLGLEAQVVGLVVVDRLVVPAEERARRAAGRRWFGRVEKLRRAEPAHEARVPDEGEKRHPDGARGQPAPGRPHAAPGRPGRGPRIATPADEGADGEGHAHDRGLDDGRDDPEPARGTHPEEPGKSAGCSDSEDQASHTSLTRPAIQPAARPTTIQETQAEVDSGNAHATARSPATVTRKEPTNRGRRRPAAARAVSSDPATAVPALRGRLGVDFSPDISQPLPGPP